MDEAEKTLCVTGLRHHLIEWPAACELPPIVLLHGWMDSAASLGHGVGVSWLFGHLRSFRGQLERLDGVSAQDVQEIARLLADANRVTVLTVGLPPLRERRRIDALVASFRSRSHVA